MKIWIPASVPRTLTTQIDEVLCKGLCNSIACVIQSMFEFGIQPTFGNTGYTRTLGPRMSGEATFQRPIPAAYWPRPTIIGLGSVIDSIRVPSDLWPITLNVSSPEKSLSRFQVNS
jgi:hypothetical protein